MGDIQLGDLLHHLKIFFNSIEFRKVQSCLFSHIRGHLFFMKRRIFRNFNFIQKHSFVLIQKFPIYMQNKVIPRNLLNRKIKTITIRTIFAILQLWWYFLILIQYVNVIESAPDCTVLYLRTYLNFTTKSNLFKLNFLSFPPYPLFFSLYECQKYRPDWSGEYLPSRLTIWWSSNID